MSEANLILTGWRFWVVRAIDGGGPGDPWWRLFSPYMPSAVLPLDGVTTAECRLRDCPRCAASQPDQCHRGAYAFAGPGALQHATELAISTGHVTWVCGEVQLDGVIRQSRDEVCASQSRLLRMVMPAFMCRRVRGLETLASKLATAYGVSVELETSRLTIEPGRNPG